MTRRSRKLLTVADGLAFPEGPRWRDGRLWFSDMHAHEVLAMTPEGLCETIHAHDGPVSGLGWLPDGRLLIVSMVDQQVLRREVDGRIVRHADLSSIATGRCNDMVVDAAGRAYVGNFGFELGGGQPKAARMARIDPDGTVVEAADDLMFPNGSVITPDGKTLIVNETFASRMTAFDVADNGALTNRRLWAQLEPGVFPDGACLDAEGAIWIASPRTHEALRVRQGGEVVERIAAEQRVMACMLGGTDRRTLYVLTASSPDPAAAAANRSSRIEAARVDAPGAGRP